MRLFFIIQTLVNFNIYILFFRCRRPVSGTSTRRTDCVQLQCGVPQVESTTGQLAQRCHHQLPGSHTRRCQLGRAEQRDGQCQYSHSAPDQPHVGCAVQGHDSGRDESRFWPVHRFDHTADGLYEPNKVWIRHTKTSLFCLNNLILTSALFDVV